MDRQWSVQTRVFVLTLLIITAVVLLYLMRDLLGPLAISAMLAYLMQPLVVYLENHTPINRKFSILLVFVIFLGLISIIPAFLTPAIIRQAESMDFQARQIVQGINDFLAQTTVFGYKVFQGVPQGIEESISQVLHPEQVFESIQVVTENLVWMVVIIITVYYLLLDWKKIRYKVYSLVPKKDQGDALRLYQLLANIWGSYLRGQLLTMLLVGTVSGVAASILQVPGAIVVGLVAAAFAMVPSVGSSAMVVVVGLVALFARTNGILPSKFWYELVVLAVFTGIHLFDNYYLRPRILGQGLQIHPAFILLGVIGGLSIGGPILALVIVPVISTGELMLVYIIARMTGADPWIGREDEFADLPEIV